MLFVVGCCLLFVVCYLLLGACRGLLCVDRRCWSLSVVGWRRLSSAVVRCLLFVADVTVVVC